MTINDILTLARAGFTAEQIARMNTPTPTPATAPATAPTPTPATAPTPAPATAPTPATAPAPTPANDVAAQIAALTAAIQANGILNSNQPKQETAEDILANILDPGRKKEGVK
ncbi:MAG: hypothetical protein IJX16_07475 [Clostridia bacterium]|nr:hypothetical protein [Clostridia bacterium]MBQ8427578.1 hypothetical protein [Clostridia bacterium]